MTNEPGNIQNNFATLTGTEKRSKWKGVLTSLLSLVVVGGTSIAMAPPATEAAVNPAPQAQLPPSFKMELYDTVGLQTPRFPSFSPEGDLYVADIATGKIMVLPDR